MSIFTDAWDSYKFYFNSGTKAVEEAATGAAVGGLVVSYNDGLPTTINETATALGQAMADAYGAVTNPISEVYNDAKNAVTGANQTLQLVIVAGVVVAAIFLLSRSGRTIVTTSGKAAGQFMKNTGKMTDAGLGAIGKVL